MYLQSTQAPTLESLDGGLYVPVQIGAVKRTAASRPQKLECCRGFYDHHEAFHNTSGELGTPSLSVQFCLWRKG